MAAGVGGCKRRVEWIEIGGNDDQNIQIVKHEM